MVDDVDSLLDARLRVRQPVVTALSVGLLAAGLAWWWAPQAGAVLALLVGVGALAGLLGRHGARVAEDAHLRHRGRVSTLVEEVVSARDELRQWQAADAALAAVDAEGAALEHAVRRSVRAVALGRAAVRLATGAAVVAIAAAVPAGAVAPATLALLLLLPVALGEVLAPLADAGALSVRTDAARARLDRLAALAPLVEDPADPVPLPGPPAPVALDRVAAGWGPEPCLRDLDLVLRPGERVAVRGPSGSGKSTLAALLVRHLDPASGAVRAGRARRARGHAGRRTLRVGLVADDPHVFASSVCENVRLARPGATDEEVADALTRARLGAWVESLPRRHAHAASAVPASPSPGASGPGSASPAPCWRTPPCWCSTSRRPTSTPPPPARWPRAAGRAPRPDPGVDHPRHGRARPRRPGRGPDERWRLPAGTQPGRRRRARGSDSVKVLPSPQADSDLDPPAVGLHDAARDGQAQAGAGDGQGLGVAGAVERREEVDLVGLGDAHPGVADVHAHPGLARTRPRPARCRRGGCTSRRC